MATKDQSSRNPISLKGIDRRPQDAVVDGSLLELINLRATNGALRPILPKKIITSPNPQYNLLYRHVISERVHAFWGFVQSETLVSDWFLPSKAELNTMYTELALFGIGSFSLVNHYTSSSEDGASYAWSQSFATGIQGNYLKNEERNVRACRAFTSTVFHELRDRGPSGGFIFWKDGNNYLEAAPADQAVSIWCNVSNFEIGTGDAMGYGQANTNAIIGRTGGADDWFLPSKDELYAMYTELHANGLGGFNTTTGYWSSSESNIDSAYLLSFSSGSWSTPDKDIAGRVRPCRKFTAEIPYDLRERGPGGGLVFAIDGTTYYEAAPEDITPVIWSQDHNDMGATGTAVGTGETNTSLIYERIGNTTCAVKSCVSYDNRFESTVSAAKVCDDYSINAAGGFLAFSLYENEILILEDLDFIEVTGNDIVFSALGNAIVVSDRQDEKTYVFLYQPDEKNYRTFTDFLPEMPLITFQRLYVSHEHVESEDLSANYDDWELTTTTILGQAQSTFKKKTDLGWLIGHYLIRCAWELFDGSIVWHTIPCYINISEIMSHFDSGWIARTDFNAYRLQYKINLTTDLMAAMKEQFKGIVSSLNIYVTHHPAVIKRENWHLIMDEPKNMVIPDTYGPTNVDEWVASEASYFELCKEGFDTLVSAEWKNAKVPSSTTDLSAGTVLTPGNLSYHSLYGDNLFAYNRRVFLGNIKNTLYKGMTLKGMMIPGSDNVEGEAYSVGLSFDIETHSGTKRVFSGWESCTYYKDADPDYYQFCIVGLIGYPDSRATTCDIWHKDAEGTIHHLYSIKMQQVFGMNFSFFSPVNKLPRDTGVDYPIVSKAASAWDIEPINTVDSYYDGNRVQATEFENPYYFPAINSYRVDGIVLGMAINAIALSQGQFGNYPIFVFTDEGIWVLEIGDGDILIVRVRSLSGTICTSKRTILGIDGGVIFLSNEGLMILQGTNPVSISEDIIGSPVSPLLGQVNFELATNNPNTYQPKQYTDAVSFELYATGASIAFVVVTLPAGEIEKEIIVSNKTYPYSYVYSLTSKQWHKITQVWDSFIISPPKVYGSKLVASNYFLHDMGIEQSTQQDVLVHIETRSIKFGESISYKKIMRILLYGLIRSLTGKPFTLFIFGSNDEQNWHIQQASNLVNPGERIILGRSLFSSKAYIILIGGMISPESYIQGIVTDVEKRYNQKLR
jgi:hypothetical protein